VGCKDDFTLEYIIERTSFNASKWDVKRAGSGVIRAFINSLMRQSGM